MSSNQNQNQIISSTSSNTTSNQNTIPSYQNKEIESFIESNYVTIKDQETKVLEFLPNRTKIIDKTDFNGKPTKRVQFTVIEVNDTVNRREKILELSRSHIAPIYNELKKGKTILELSRLGSGKDTRYFIKTIR